MRRNSIKRLSECHIYLFLISTKEKQGLENQKQKYTDHTFACGFDSNFNLLFEDSIAPADEQRIDY